MRTEQIEIYKFEDLSEEAREKAISDLRESEFYLDYEWFDYLYEDFKEELKDKGISCNTFYFDLYGNEFNIDKPYIEDNNKFLKNAIGSKYLIMFNLENKEFEVSLSENCYTDFEVLENEDKELTEEEYKANTELEIKINEEADEYLSNLKRDFLKRLNNDYEYLQSDEAIREHIEANEFEYLKNGEQY